MTQTTADADLKWFPVLEEGAKNRRWVLGHSNGNIGDKINSPQAEVYRLASGEWEFYLIGHPGYCGRQPDLDNAIKMANSAYRVMRREEPK